LTARPQQSTCVVTAQRPNGVTNYASIDRTPAVLAALLAVLGIAVLGQFIVVSGRQRRRDFAILKTLGLFRRQVRAITARQVSTLTCLALLVGARPAGLLGRRRSGGRGVRGLADPHRRTPRLRPARPGGINIGPHPLAEVFHLHGFQLVSWNVYVLAGLGTFAFMLAWAAIAWRPGSVQPRGH
jgi:hypothetical protein